MIETPINAHFYMIGWLWVITCIGREAQNIETKVKSLRSPIHDLGNRKAVKPSYPLQS